MIVIVINSLCLLNCKGHFHFRKINVLEEELKIVGNNMKALEISEQEVIQ